MGPAHRAASAGLLGALPGWRLRHDRGHRGRLLVFGLSPDGRYLAVGGDINLSDLEYGRRRNDPYGSVQVWELASGRCVNLLSRIEGGITGYGPEYQRRLRWHPGGTRIGMIFGRNAIGVYDPFGEDSAPGDRCSMPSMWREPTYGDEFPWCWSPDGTHLAIGCFDQESTFQGHEAGVELGADTAIPFSLYEVSIGADPEGDKMDGPRLVDSGYQAARSPDDGDEDDGDEDDGDEDHAPAWGRYNSDVLEWSDDGARLTALAKPEVYSVDVATGTIRILRDRALVDPSASISPDGRLLAVVADAHAVVWDITVQPPVQRLRYPLDQPDGAFTVFDAHGAQLAVLTGDGVLVFALPSGVLRHRLDGVPRARVRWFGDGCAVAFSSTGDLMVVVSNADDGSAGSVTVWRLGEQAHPLWTAPALAGVRGVTFGDGDRSLAGWGWGSLQFWDAVTGRERNRYQQQSDGEDDDLVFHCEAGHPLAYPGGWAGDLFPTDPAFAVPDDGAFDRPDGPRWHWFTAFDTGLVVCPEP